MGKPYKESTWKKFINLLDWVRVREPTWSGEHMMRYK